MDEQKVTCMIATDDAPFTYNKRTLLNGICPEAADLLKARHCPLTSLSAASLGVPVLLLIFAS
ncbi:hypothetical protein [Roseinatronobacter sp.]